MTKSNLYVIGIYGDSASVLGREGATLDECKRSINWLRQGGTETEFHICAPTEIRGTFKDIATGQLFDVTRGALTEQAFGEMLDRAHR